MSSIPISKNKELDCVLELRSQFLMEMDQMQSEQYGVLAPIIN
jgi:hypothetical protein